MADIIRDAPLGQIIRFVTGNRYLQYPEEREDWQSPINAYTNEQHSTSTPASSTTLTPTTSSSTLEKDLEDEQLAHALRNTATVPDLEGQHTHAGANRSLSRISTRPNMTHVETQRALEAAYSDAVRQETMKQQPSVPIQPSTTSDGRILVDWYSSDDQENPQNWSKGKKILVASQIYLYTLAVYMAGAIYTPAIPSVMEKFGLSETVAALGLSIYVVGYGVGPLLFSPLSEIPIIGRNPPYLVTFTIYVILIIPLALIDNFPGFVVLRFFQGFFGSPALATGGASLGDMFSLLDFPFWLTFWAAAATCGPAFGPTLAGFAIPATDWHWSMWITLWLAAPVFIFLFISLPETSAQNILLRRAARLRKRYGASNIVSQSEIDQSQLTVGEIAKQNLWRPLQINIQDPAVLFTSLFIGLVYGIFYSYFETFPFVYGAGLPSPSPTRGYGMNLGEQGLIFLSVSVGVVIAIAIYVIYLRYVFEPEVRENRLGAPERRLVPGIYASFFQPVGLFLFAWTAFNAPQIHWIVPTIGVVIYMVSTFLLFQVVFMYLSMTYPQYAASLFGANDFARSSIAAGAVHFAIPLMKNLGIGRGVSLLGGLTIMGVIGIFVLYFYGAKLRMMSRFAVK